MNKYYREMFKEEEYDRQKDLHKFNLKIFNNNKTLHKLLYRRSKTIKKSKLKKYKNH